MSHGVLAKILICEDDSGIREAIAIALEQEGYRISFTSDFQAIETSIKNEMPDVILLDLHLQGGNGETILARIPTLFQKNTPRIILMSAHASLPEIAATHHVDYLMKPFDLDLLRVTIERNLAR